MAASEGLGRRLAGCHGYVVVAADGPIGSVETPVFFGVSREPDFLIVRVAGSMRGTFRIVSTGSVKDVAVERAALTLGMTSREVASLPEVLPLASRYEPQAPA